VALPRAPAAADTLAALEQARSIRLRLEDGADFGDIARAESADPGSAPRGGDLGTITRGQTVPGFEQAVWTQPLNRVGDPVLTQFGYHLIRVDGRTDDEAQVRHILIPVRLTSDSEDRLLARADSLEALTERVSLEEAAQQLGLRVRSAELTEDVPFLPAVGRIAEGLDWALKEATPGEVSPIFDDSPDAYYMIELVARTAARTLTLEEATPFVRSRLVAQKKLERARAIGRDIVDRVRAGADLREVATARGATIAEAGPFTRVDAVPGLGRFNAAIGAAFGVAEGRISGLVEADGGLYIIRVLERTEADREEFEEQKELYRAQFAAALEQQRWEQFLRGLRQEAEIRDLRRDVLRPASLAGGRFF
jgi:peptidyl-prolyl cis-trans isomerase D